MINQTSDNEIFDLDDFNENEEELGPNSPPLSSSSMSKKKMNKKKFYNQSKKQNNKQKIRA